MRFLVTELNNTELANIVAVRLLLHPSGDGDRSCHDIYPAVRRQTGYLHITLQQHLTDR